MTRQERERFVLDLSTNQGKNICEIAQEARMSFVVSAPVCTRTLYL